MVALPELERMLVEALAGIRRFQAHRKPSRRLQWNRVLLHVWPMIDLSPEEIHSIMSRMAPATTGLGVEVLLVQGRLREPDGSQRERVLRVFAPAGKGVVVEVDDPPTEPLRPLDESAQRVASARRRGMLHPAEIVKLLGAARGDDAATGQPLGEFVEHDLDASGRLVPVDRPPATNHTGVVVGLIRNFTERHPEGMLRVALLGDPTRALGSLAEPECRRIIGRARPRRGAAACRSSGSRSRPAPRSRWTAARRPWTGSRWCCAGSSSSPRRGGEINVVVAGINVGAQPYWNAEATMLMHTRGILVMTPESAMVLTGKQSLDYSGGVSAEDNLGIGGYERIMGPNGQAQYWALDIAGACRVLLALLRACLRGAGRALPAPGRDHRPGATATPARRRTARRARTSSTSATSSPTRPTRGARSRSTSVR